MPAIVVVDLVFLLWPPHIADEINATASSLSSPSPAISSCHLPASSRPLRPLSRASSIATAGHNPRHHHDLPCQLVIASPGCPRSPAPSSSPPSTRSLRAHPRLFPVAFYMFWPSFSHGKPHAWRLSAKRHPTWPLFVGRRGQLRRPAPHLHGHASVLSMLLFQFRQVTLHNICN
jgi:hypothetical protein